MRVLLALNGPLPAAARLAAEPAAWLLAADGGAAGLVAAGLSPRFVVGDLDSIGPELAQKLGPEVLVRRDDQGKTDGEKAVEFALEKGVTTLVVCGVAGGRLDHQLNNLSTLSRFAGQVNIEVLDASGRGYFVRRRLRLSAAIGQQVSLIPFGRVEGVRTQGLRYPLADETLAWAGRSGQSNEATAVAVDIVVAEGVLFVFAADPGC